MSEVVPGAPRLPKAVSCHRSPRRLRAVPKIAGQERTSHLLIERIDGEWKYAGMAEK
jgi:hypothetical protein